jgi:two-component system response regulator YesN
MRIVVVDSDENSRAELISLIRRHTEFLVVGEADSGLDGIDLCRQLRPDVIITDLKLREVNGVDMLTILRDRHFLKHAVIVSGIEAHFSDAQRVIDLGIDKFLIKPVSVNKLCKALADINRSICEDAWRDQTILSDSLRALLIGYLNDSYILRAFAETNHLLLIMVYSQSLSEDFDDTFRDLTNDIAISAGISQSITCRLDDRRMVLLAGASDLDILNSFEDNLCSLVLDSSCVSSSNNQASGGAFAYDSKPSQKSPLGTSITSASAQLSTAINATTYTDTPIIWIRCNATSVKDIPDRFRQLTKGLRRSLGFSDFRVYINLDNPYAKYNSIVDMNEFNTQIRNTVCNEDTATIETLLDDFEIQLLNGNYSPAAIIDASISMITTISGLLKEIDTKRYREFIDHNLIAEGALVNTRDELKTIFQTIRGILIHKHPLRCDNISNYIVKKTINYIRLNYAEQISLESVAEHIEISPEYLSTLFYKEIGTNFTTFVKRFRISHGKRLLIGSDMKIADIAHAVGFIDSKYFARVFKEICGVSPAEFRKIN